MTETATVVKRGPRWRRRAIFAIAVLVIISPVFTFRVSRGDRCPICGEDRGETYWQVVVLRIPVSEGPAPACIAGDHRWFENWRTTKLLISSGRGFHGDAFLDWTSMSRLQLRPWLLGSPQAADRRRVLRALRVATREELDEILSSDVVRELGEAVLEGPDPGWVSRLLSWADRVLARARV